MTIGVGGSSAENELQKLNNMTADLTAIPKSEFEKRIKKARSLMKDLGIAALYLNAGTNLYYFTGTRWHASERMVGAILPLEGELEYISPVFEISTLNEYMLIEGKVNGWSEHENPYDAFDKTLKNMGITKGVIAIDEATNFFIFDGIQKSTSGYEFTNASSITAACRMIKSQSELALMQRAKDMTIEVHKAVGAILREGISTLEVAAFIHEAHKAVGAPSGSYFCIVLFGEATAYPHGVKNPQILKEGDMVLIDTGCQVQGYISDITRTFVFGEPSERQREVWNSEKKAQLAAFEKAQIGIKCGDVDLAARKSLDADGYGPEYDTPGLPHRTGHGIGLDIHEWPYLNWGDDTVLAAGMCFSNEPMICIYGEFGVRLEDHFYMTKSGPEWFTQPSESIDNPFNL